MLADRLVRGDTPESREILRNTIIMLVPCQNPDGVDIVGDWYRSTLGTPAEGSQPPALYHYYTGHDNNRDWYAFTQVETRYGVDSLYTPWTPPIVNDIHQQGANGGRIFIPPYMDPVEPNIDPILTASTNALGMAMAWRMMAEGKTGVATNASYDQWSPARQYSLNHHGVRILTETASARLATPIDVPFEMLGTARGYDARVTCWNFPARWPGGRWTIGDIVAYQSSASWAMLAAVGARSRQWLESYAALGDRALAAEHPWTTTDVPTAFVIPRAQRDTQARAAPDLDAAARAGGSARVGAGWQLHRPNQAAVRIVRESAAGTAAVSEPERVPRRTAQAPVRRDRAHAAAAVRCAGGNGAGAAAGGIRGAAACAGTEVHGPWSERKVAEADRDLPELHASMDEGWTRWLFDVNRIPYRTVLDADLRAGNLQVTLRCHHLPGPERRATPSRSRRAVSGFAARRAWRRRRGQS